MQTRVALVSQHPIPDDLLADAAPSQLVAGERAWGHLRSFLAEGDAVALRARCRELPGVSAAVVSGPLALEPAGLILCDVDSTLTSTEAVDLLAEHAGRGDEVAAITERAMRGELDFEESLRARVAALAGLATSSLDEVASRMTLSPGASDLIARAHEVGCRIGVTSGGFRQLVGPLAERLGLDFWNAIELGVRDGRLTGVAEGPIVDREQKTRDLHRFAAQFDVPLTHTVAVGDGANDLGMIGAAALGIAYCAKPATVAGADATLNFPRLDAVAGMALER